MIELWQSIAHGLSVAGGAVIITMSSAFLPTETVITPPSTSPAISVSAQVAMITETVVPKTVEISAATNTPPNLPPIIVMPVAATAVASNLLPVIKILKTSPKTTKANAAISTVALAQTQPIKSSPSRIPAITTAVTSPVIQHNGTPITAQAFLASTTISLVPTLDGSLEAHLTGKNLIWNMDDATVGGGTTGIQQSDVAFSCDPIQNIPVQGAVDQHPSFKVRTSYDCTISLTPTSGNDLRVQTKDFTFQTGPGSLVAMPSPAMNPTLLDGENDGGIVFMNQDSQAVTIHNLTVDVSFIAINTSTPVVLRFADPNTGASLFDFHLENLPADPGRAYTQSQQNVSIPLTFTIGANNQKMLVVQALGVHNLDFTGADPTIAVALKAVSATPSDTQIVIRLPLLAWTCTPDITPYNPFATSTPSQPCAH